MDFLITIHLDLSRFMPFRYLSSLLLFIRVSLEILLNSSLYITRGWQWVFFSQILISRFRWMGRTQFSVQFNFSTNFSFQLLGTTQA